MNAVVQMDADILPGHGLGGLALRTHLRDLAGLLSGLGVWKAGTYSLESIYEARYQLSDEAIEIAADVRNGKVFRLTALPGYRGTLFGRIRVGMTAREAMSVEPRLYYDEAEELILCRDIAGVALNVAAVDPEPSAVPEMSISGISVYAKEITTATGQRGEW